MGKRVRVGFIFIYDHAWIGGTYYVQNIVSALATLPDSKQPEITLFTDAPGNLEYLRRETGYKHLETTIDFPIKLSSKKIFFNKYFKKITGSKLFQDYYQDLPIDLVYPRQHGSIRGDLPPLFWIPDFQEAFYPQYFSQEELEQRKNDHLQIAQKGNTLVLSSYNALSHFQSLYPEARCTTFVMPFAVTHPAIHHLDSKETLAKYNLDAAYFFVPNQFWAHKNHMVVLRALALLKKEDVKITVAFSGNEADYRNKDHIALIKSYVKDHDLQRQVLFLGFLPREDQLLLMRESIAIVQPSLFEGWSTVVEDAKALGKHIVLSDIDVHKEQISDGATFFQAEDAPMLSRKLVALSKNHPSFIDHKYGEKKQQFAERFAELLDVLLLTN